jgi:hypothetical protein
LLIFVRGNRVYFWLSFTTTYSPLLIVKSRTMPDVLQQHPLLEQEVIVAVERLAQPKSSPTAYMLDVKRWSAWPNLSQGWF